MKKLLIVGMGLFFLLPLTNNSAQTIAQSTGSYYELAQEYNALFQGKEMSKDEEERLLKTIPAEIKTKLEEVKKLNKNKYYELLRGFPYGVTSWTGQVEGLIDSKADLIKQKELDVDVELLALKYKSADTPTQSKLKNDLSAKLAELFEIREAQKEREVKRLEKRLQELKESLQARKQNKSEIVQRRIQEMLGDSKYLRWE